MQGYTGILTKILYGYVASNDYHLSPNSPCIGAGTFVVGRDLDGENRPDGGSSDT